MMNPMNFICRFLIVFSVLIPNLFAANEPLVVGVANYSPPFVTLGANNQIYGFDIDMMNNLCAILKRTCQFKVMRFDQLLPAVENNMIDAAVSSITITPERAKLVHFTLPYLLSYSRFLAKAPQTQAFSLALLNNKTIGIESGSIFKNQIIAMGIQNPKVEEFSTSQDMLEQLESGQVDFLLLDSPETLFWEANSAGALIKVGPAYMYGFGLGIAAKSELITPLNKALVQYQSSPAYKANFTRYVSQF